MQRVPQTVLRRWGERCLDALLPRLCVLCGQPGGSRNLCADCQADLPRPGHVCLTCALPVHTTAELLCGRCLQRAPPWDRVVAALLYVYPADRIICRFKFGRDFSCGHLLGAEMRDAIVRAGQALPDLIAPVPLHRVRHFSRTFNQADFLARFLGRAMAVPVHSQLLSRRRRTGAQSGLDAAGRKRNIRGAFQRGRSAMALSPDTRVALVDDVMTTGTTLVECTKTLRNAGINSVSVWVAARAQAP